jgi:hypothetical protein
MTVIYRRPSAAASIFEDAFKNLWDATTTTIENYNFVKLAERYPQANRTATAR